MKVVHFFLGFLVNLWTNLFNSRLGHRLEICRHEMRCEITSYCGKQHHHSWKILQTSAWTVVVVQSLYIILLLLYYKTLHQFQVDRAYTGILLLHLLFTQSVLQLKEQTIKLFYSNLNINFVEDANVCDIRFFKTFKAHTLIERF